MKKTILIFKMAIIILMVGCATNENQIRSALEKNPDLVFEVIEKNPEKFIEVVNRAARKAQENQYANRIIEMKKKQEEDLKNPKKPNLEASRVLVGKLGSEITLVEYADFQCPACRMAHRNLKEYLNKYANNVNFTYKHMPLPQHKEAYIAAQYYEAIFLQSREKAHKFYDYLYENQNRISGEDFLKMAATRVGADLKRIAKDLHSEKIKNIIEADMQEFEKFEFTGTPAIILNGVALFGAQPVEELERIAALTSNKKN